VRQMQDIPSELKETLLKLAAGCRVLAMEGHNDMSLGHLSFRDPQGRGLWLKKAQRGLEEIFDPSDFLLIDFEGRRLESEGFCHSEWPIHTEIMLATRCECRRPYPCVLLRAVLSRRAGA